MSIANPLWGAPRIHGELLKSASRSARPASPNTWSGEDTRRRKAGEFIRNHADGIAARICLSCRQSSRLLYGLLIMAHGRRHILWFGVTAHPTAEWIANQVTEACGWEQAPCYLIRDREGAYGEVFIRRLRSIGIRDRPTSPLSPWQNAYAERLIGSIRRECLDHVVVLGERHLRHVLLSYMNYYNETRTHLSLNKTRPYRVLLRGQGVFFAAQSSADCITNMVRQEKPDASSGRNSRPGKGNEPPHRESSLGLMEATT
jgi:transposase InsO family protein